MQVSTHWSSKLTWLAFFGALVAALTTQGMKTDWVHGVVKDEGLFMASAAAGGSMSSAKYSVYELPLFVVIGILGGLLGALFNHLNGLVNKRRRRICAEGGCISRTIGVRAFKVRATSSMHPVHLPCISPASHLHLGCISPASRLHLGRCSRP